MIRPVLKMGEELLLEKAMPVKAFGTPELRRLVVDMWDTMDVEGGIGIAAPQVGVSLQVICFGTKESEEASGARRVPRTVLGLRGRVVRPVAVRYKGFDLEGNRIERTVDGLHARVVQHEADHLVGILYPMRVTDWRTFGYSEVLFPEKSKA